MKPRNIITNTKGFQSHSAIEPLYCISLLFTVFTVSYGIAPDSSGFLAGLAIGLLCQLQFYRRSFKFYGCANNIYIGV